MVQYVQYTVSIDYSHKLVLQVRPVIMVRFSSPSPKYDADREDSALPLKCPDVTSGSVKGIVKREQKCTIDLSLWKPENVQWFNI